MWLWTLFAYVLATCNLNISGVSASNVYNVGVFTVTIEDSDFHICSSSDERHIVFQTSPSSPFLSIGNATVTQPPIRDGNYQLEESVQRQTSAISIENVNVKSELNIEMSGQLFNVENIAMATYTFNVSVQDMSSKQLLFDARVSSMTNHTIDRLFFSYWCDANEAFFGFGESFTNLNLRSRVVPVLVSEQGVGRGLQPITDALNNDTEGTGGHWYTTYAPKPVYLTNQNRSLFFHNSEVGTVTCGRELMPLNRYHNSTSQPRSWCRWKSGQVLCRSQ